jgi:hypothetical protein
MFVFQPEIPVPLAVGFPFPAWATRRDECEPSAPAPFSNGRRAGGDPFTRMPKPPDDDVSI